MTTPDPSSLKRVRLPNPLLLHWILNPGLAVNEVVLGQRIPRLMLRDPAQPYMSFDTTGFVPCPHCGAVHSVQLWDRNRFGNWFGLVCPDCEGVIPCLWNLTSRVLLVLFFPIVWLVRRAVRTELLKTQLASVRAQRAALAKGVPPPARRTPGFWALAIAFGGAMVIGVSLADATQGDLSGRKLLINLVVYSAAGLAFGAMMTWLERARRPHPRGPVTPPDPDTDS